MQPEVTHWAVDLRVAKQELHSTEIARLAIEDADLRHVGDVVEGDDLIVHDLNAQAS